MDSHNKSAGDTFSETLIWIGERLDEPLTLEQIAEFAGLSPYHFSRLFTARIGRSVMFYVRFRRLARAAARLRTEPRLKLIDLAFDCGFESQEAFTRAFRKSFGVSPGRYRRFHQEDIMTTAEQSDIKTPVEQLPGLTTREAFTVAGLSRRFDQASIATAPALWDKLVPRFPFPGQTGWDSYGVVWSMDRRTGTFSYMAAGGLDPAAPTPEGLERKEVPAGTYLVFRITLDGGPIHPQMKSAMRQIWGELIPASGHAIADAPDFERYDGRTPPDRPGAVVDFHVPVKA